MRAAAVALSELAPSSHFYAEGRRVKVDQVDLTLSQPRDWRLCRSCAHAEEILTADPPAAACPRCGDVMWPDNGRKRRMLRLRQVMATTSDRDSRIGDDSDDREPAFFTRQLLVDFTEDNIRESWAIDDPDFPFGFEFLTKAVFRDINFGERVAGAEAVEVAGVPAVRVGFRVCRHCGKVQRNSDEPEHVLTCPTRSNQGEAAQAGAYIFIESLPPRRSASCCRRRPLPVRSGGSILLSRRSSLVSSASFAAPSGTFKPLSMKNR
jgi:DEAD/DEAH box helicase domain-containing protein